MPDNTTPDTSGNYRDNSGQLYNTFDNKPPTTVQTVILPGGETGTFSGGTVTKNN
jgi:hypothetical protein